MTAHEHHGMGSGPDGAPSAVRGEAPLPASRSGARKGAWLAVLCVAAAAGTFLGPEGSAMVRAVRAAAAERRAWAAEGTAYRSRMPWIQDLYRLLADHLPSGARVTVLTRGGAGDLVADRHAQMLVAYVVCPARVDTPATRPLAEAEWIYALDPAGDRLADAGLSDSFERVGDVPHHFLYRRRSAPAPEGRP